MSANDTTVVTTRIDAALKARLDALARCTKRSKSYLAAEAIAAYVELNEWQIGEIRAGIAELDAAAGFSPARGYPRADRCRQPGSGGASDGAHQNGGRAARPFAGNRPAGTGRGYPRTGHLRNPVYRSLSGRGRGGSDHHHPAQRAALARPFLTALNARTCSGRACGAR